MGCLEKKENKNMRRTRSTKEIYTKTSGYNSMPSSIVPVSVKFQDVNTVQIVSKGEQAQEEHTTVKHWAFQEATFSTKMKK